MMILSSLELLLLVVFTSYQVAVQLQERDNLIEWRETEEWSSCSQTCDPGIQQKRLICVEKSPYSEKLVSDEMCLNVPSLSTTTRECNMGYCKDSYFWKTNKWSDCSQTCGGGRKTRDIECIYDEGNGNSVLSEVRFCNFSFRPEAFSLCNLLDCPLIFIPGDWGKCIQKRKCQPGTQSRLLTCVSILKNGKRKEMPRHACSRTQKPPVAWQQCYDSMNTKECVKKNPAIPRIKSENGTLIQMRKTKILSIGVGQVSYVLLFTKIVINCPVTFYVPQDIVWKHESSTYSYKGRSKERIRVDKKGRLRIRRTELVDQGTWTCIAGQKNASAILKLRNPSIGYQDWIVRTALFNREMMNEDPKSGLSWYEDVQWIKKPWSICSVTCGGKGIQTRDVQCEKIDSHHYIILTDKECENRRLKKPEVTQSCQMATQCPKWVLTEFDQRNCTNKCLRIGFSQIQGKLYCTHQGKYMPFEACNKKERPQIECENEECQVTWKKSKWSKCSKSCGGQGIRARYLICVWKNTLDPAGSLCYSQKLPLPKVIKTCSAPKCNLKCVDLSSNCNFNKNRCAISTFRYICCKTCSQLNNKSKIEVKSTKQVESEKLMKNGEQVIKKSNISEDKNPKVEKNTSEKYNELKNVIKNEGKSKDETDIDITIKQDSSKNNVSRRVNNSP